MTHRSFALPYAYKGGFKTPCSFTRGLTYTENMFTEFWLSSAFCEQLFIRVTNFGLSKCYSLVSLWCTSSGVSGVITGRPHSNHPFQTIYNLDQTSILPKSAIPNRKVRSKWSAFFLLTPFFFKFFIWTFLSLKLSSGHTPLCSTSIISFVLFCSAGTLQTRLYPFCVNACGFCS